MVHDDIFGRRNIGRTLGTVESGNSLLVLPESLKNKGIVFMGMKEAMNAYPDLSYSQKFEKGFFFSVFENVSAEEAFEIRVNVEGGVERNAIHIGNNSHVHVVIKESGEAKRDSSLDVVIGKNASLHLVLQNTSKGEQMQARNIKVGEHGRFHFAGALLGTSRTEMQTSVLLDGRNASLRFNEIIFATGTESHALHTQVVHAYPETDSKIKVKSVLKDQAFCFSDAMVKMLKDSQQSTSHLANHALLLNSGARAEAIPGMEIEAKDVRAGHSASVSPVNKEHLFYLMSRGLTEEEAKRTIVLGFLEDAIDDEQTRKLFLEALEEKWMQQK